MGKRKKMKRIICRLFHRKHWVEYAYNLRTQWIRCGVYGSELVKEFRREIKYWIK